MAPLCFTAPGRATWHKTHREVGVESASALGFDITGGIRRDPRIKRGRLKLIHGLERLVKMERKREEVRSAFDATKRGVFRFDALRSQLRSPLPELASMMRPSLTLAIELSICSNG